MKSRLQAASRPEAVHYASLAVCGTFVLVVAASGWFWADEWSWLTPGPFTTPDMLFAPYGCHCYAVPVLVYRTLFTVFGTGSYLPYVGTVVLLQVGAAHLMWRIQIRNGVRPWMATVIVPLFLLYGPGWENSIWGVMVAFSGALLGCLATIWLVDRNDVSRRRQIVAWAACTTGLACGCVGLTGLFAGTVISWYRRGLRAAWVMASVPTALYLLWFATWGYTAESNGLPGQATPALFKDMPAFAIRMLVTTFSDLAGSQLFGAAAVCAIVLALLWRPLSRMRNSLTPALLVVSTLFLNLTVAYGHVNGGNPSDSRYVDLDLAFMLPVAGQLLNEIRLRWLAAVAAASLLLMSARGAVMVVIEATALHAVEDRVQTSALIAAYSTDPTILADARAGEIVAYPPTVATLRTLARKGELPQPPHVSADEMNDTLAFLQIAQESAKPAGVPRGEVALLSGPASRDDSCWVSTSSADQHILLRVEKPGVISISPQDPAIIDTLVEMPSNQKTLVPVAEALVPPKSATYLQLSKSGLVFALDGVGKGARIC
jgi:hypothetical protein